MTTSYAAKQLTQTLQDARVAAGISQRELAERAGLRQNHLALIEAGTVDPRASTLSQLARALDLELVVVPRRLLPAVQSITGGPPKPEPEAGLRSVRGTPIRTLRHIQRRLAALKREYPASPEVAQAQREAQLLLDVGTELQIASLQPLRRSVFWLGRARTNRGQAQTFMAKAAAQLLDLRRTLPRTARLEQLPQVQPAAYGLEDEVS